MTGKELYSEHIYNLNIIKILYFGFINSLIAVIIDQIINILMDLSTLLQQKINNDKD